MAAALHGIKVLNLTSCMPSRSGKTYRAGTGRKRTWMRSYPGLSSQVSNYLSLQRDGVLGLSHLSSCLSIYAEKTTQRCFGITPARSTGKTGGTPTLWVTLCPCCPSEPTLGLVLFQAPPGNLDPGREPDLAETLGVLEELLERVGPKAAAMKGCAAPKKSRTIIPALTCSVFCEPE